MGCTHMSTEVEEAMQSLAHQIEDAYCPLCLRGALEDCTRFICAKAITTRALTR